MSLRQDLPARIFSTLAEATADPPGVTRASYGEGEQFAHDLVRREAEALGCETAVDPAGNLLMTLPGRDRAQPCLLLGSHLDSVPHGGNYDGAAGVVAGLALIAHLVERQITPPQDIAVMAFRAEEAAWFPLSYAGSHLALGRFDPTLLGTTRSDSGLSLEEHMKSSGFDPEAVRDGRCLLDPKKIGAFVEVHIEQGPVLIGEGLPLGLVTAIAGGFRYTAGQVTGTWGHSGATPKGFRQDAVLGFTDLVNRSEVTWQELEDAGLSTTITFAQVATDPALHGGSRVAGALSFCLDVRSIHDAALARVQQAIQSACQDVEATRGTRVDLGPAFTWPAAEMTPALLDRLEAAAQSAKLPIRRLPSGAGHDAAVFAEAGVPTAMIFLRNDKGSHNPEEAMDLADLDCAVSLLAQFVMEGAPV